jgi:hypothetical protein
MSALEPECLTAATLYGLTPCDLVVTVDDGSLDPSRLAALGRGAATLAVVVSSTAAAGLLRADPAIDSGDAGDDRSAFARARAWAHGQRAFLTRSGRSASPEAHVAGLAPPMTPTRLRALAADAAAAGLVLVEPELALVRGRPAPRFAVDRAVLATVLLGPLARPLLFVPASRAPKRGIPKLREDRVLDAWVARSGGTWRTPLASEPFSLHEAAFGVLAEENAPLPVKELLRRARTRSGSASASDGKVLARHLLHGWLRQTIALSVTPPLQS